MKEFSGERQGAEASRLPSNLTQVSLEVHRHQVMVLIRCEGGPYVTREKLGQAQTDMFHAHNNQD